MMPPRKKRKERSSPSPQHDPNIPSSSSAASENISSSSAADNFSSPSSMNPLVLPPGYRFAPYDDELILAYLKPYVKGGREPSFPVHHVNIYDSNPQQLTEQFEKANEKEWFFISERTKIQKGGKNLKRGDNGGYWHGKGTKEQVEDRQGVVVGGYKTNLTYYVGKQPNGVKSDWIMTEYTLDSSPANDEVVDHALCKIYLCPTAVKKKRSEREENKNQKKGVATIDLQEQPRYAEYQPPHHPQFLPATVDSHPPQPHDVAYQQPQWILPLPLQGQDSGFGTLTQSNDFDNNMLKSSQEDCLDICDYDVEGLTKDLESKMLMPSQEDSLDMFDGNLDGFTEFLENTLPMPSQEDSFDMDLEKMMPMSSQEDYAHYDMEDIFNDLDNGKTIPQAKLSS